MHFQNSPTLTSALLCNTMDTYPLLCIPCMIKNWCLLRPPCLLSCILLDCSVSDLKDSKLCCKFPGFQDVISSSPDDCVLQGLSHLIAGFPACPAVRHGLRYGCQFILTSRENKKYIMCHQSINMIWTFLLLQKEVFFKIHYIRSFLNTEGVHKVN